LPEPRGAHAAALLADGRVLVAGGAAPGRTIVGTAFVYDPVIDRWSAVGPLHLARYKTAIAALPDGGAYVIGGQTADDPAARLESIEHYDPTLAAFTAGPMMTEPRYKISDAVVVLRDGRVVVAGGFGVDVLSGSSVRRLESQPRVERLFPTATELAGGTVLITGGYSMRTRVTATAELIHP
jgi:hypothetical protein